MKTEPPPKALIRRTLHYYLIMVRRYKWGWLLNIVMPMAGIACGDIAFRYYLGKLFGQQLPHINNTPLGAIWHTFYILMILVIAQVFFWRINDYTYLRRQAKSLRDMEQFLLTGCSGTATGFSAIISR